MVSRLATALFGRSMWNVPQDVSPVAKAGKYKQSKYEFHVHSLTEHEPDAAYRPVKPGLGYRTSAAVTASTANQATVTGHRSAAIRRPARAAGRVSDRTARRRTARTTGSTRGSTLPAGPAVAGHGGQGESAAVGVGEAAWVAVGTRAAAYAACAYSVQDGLSTRTRHGQAAFAVPASAAATAVLVADTVRKPIAATAARTPNLHDAGGVAGRDGQGASPRRGVVKRVGGRTAVRPQTGEDAAH